MNIEKDLIEEFVSILTKRILEEFSRIERSRINYKKIKALERHLHVSFTSPEECKLFSKIVVLRRYAVLVSMMELPIEHEQKIKKEAIKRLAREIIRLANKGLKMNPTNKLFWYARGCEELLVFNKEKQGLRDLRKAIELDSNFSDAYFDIGYYYLTKCDFGDLRNMKYCCLARKYFTKSVKTSIKKLVELSRIYASSQLPQNVGGFTCDRIQLVGTTKNGLFSKQEKEAISKFFTWLKKEIKDILKRQETGRDVTSYIIKLLQRLKCPAILGHYLVVLPKDRLALYPSIEEVNFSFSKETFKGLFKVKSIETIVVDLPFPYVKPVSSQEAINVFKKSFRDLSNVIEERTGISLKYVGGIVELFGRKIKFKNDPKEIDKEYDKLLEEYNKTIMEEEVHKDFIGKKKYPLLRRIPGSWYLTVME